MKSLQTFVRAQVSDIGAATLARDALGGVIASLVTVAYCISFSALIFQGYIADGFALGLSALLMGTAVTGLIVTLTTTLAPADAGPDTPAVAVMSVLAASTAAFFSAKDLGPELAVIHVMTALTVATLFTGLLLFGLGVFRLGVWLRFVPYPVIGGFLAASGWLLISGGVEVMSGIAPELSSDSISDISDPERLPQLLIGLGFAIGVFVVKRRVESFLVLPIAFIGSLILLNSALLGLGWADYAGGTQSWFLEDIGELGLWSPVTVIPAHDIDWRLLARSAAEIGAVGGVTAVSMLLDVSSLEVVRQKSADLDKELRTNGIANVAAAFLGGAVGNLSLNGSVLIKEAGAVTRFSGAAAAIVSALVLFFGSGIASLIPKPLLGGLLSYVGLVILTEALIRSPAQRSRTDLLLAGAIMLGIVYFGYLLGVLLGVIGACLLFAFSYSRIGVVRRHLTRQDFSSNVERPLWEARLLNENGRQIHVFWLSGFIFFGSSNGLFEYVRRFIDEQHDPPVRYIVLDFSGVPGLDTSAVLSLVKLSNYCDEHGAALIYSGLTPRMMTSFDAAGFFSSERPHRVFATRNEALEWCENSLLSSHEGDDSAAITIEDWLIRELGEDADIDRLISYFERLDLEAADVLINEGDPADSIDLIASGSLAIMIEDEFGRPLRLRRMAGQTVVGEMGFYRDAPRTASVVAEGPTIAYRLTRTAFKRMQEKDPDLVSDFHSLIVRVLSDRLEFANREISALL